VTASLAPQLLVNCVRGYALQGFFQGFRMARV